MAAEPQMTPEALCLDHARIAARHAQMRALDTHAMGIAFVVQGLAQIFDIDDEEAAGLAIDCCAQAGELLIGRVLLQAEQGGIDETKLAEFRAIADAAISGPPSNATA